MFEETLKAVARELIYPLRVPSVILKVLAFTALLSFVLALLAIPPNAFLILLWILTAIALVVVLPYFLRSLMQYLECRARGRRPQVTGMEQFSWFDNTWSLFPIVPLSVAGWAMYRAVQVDSSTGFWLVLAATLAVLPAVLTILAITLSLWKLLQRMGPSYVIAPVFVALLVAVTLLLPDLPVLFDVMLLLYLAFVLLGACGAAIRPFDIIDEADIAPDTAAGEERRRVRGDAQREKLLTHAYGFASRGNTTGAIELLVKAGDDEADPIAARDWYFRQMLNWEDRFAALKLAQTIIHEHLAAGDQVAAVKLMLRCQLLDASFAPLSGDIEAAIAAADACGNPDLARILRNSY